MTNVQLAYQLANTLLSMTTFGLVGAPTQSLVEDLAAIEGCTEAEARETVFRLADLGYIAQNGTGWAPTEAGIDFATVFDAMMEDIENMVLTAREKYERDNADELRDEMLDR